MTIEISSIWLNDWKDASKKDLEQLFGLANSELDSINILLASYKLGDESAYAFILFSVDDVLYEVNASHDSEVDFEDQWQPEETTIEALLFRLNKGHLGSAKASENIFAVDLTEILHKLMH